MREIRTSGLMSGDGRRSQAKPDCGGGAKGPPRTHRKATATAPVLDSTLDPQLDQLGDPGPGLEQGLQHQPGPPAPGVGLVDEPEFLFEREAVDRAAAVGRSPEPGLPAGGFEHRLALLIVDALAGEEGGDGVGDPFDAAHDPVCRLAFGVQAHAS